MWLDGAGVPQCYCVLEPSIFSPLWLSVPWGFAPFVLAEDGSVELSLAEVHTFYPMCVYTLKKKRTKPFTEKKKRRVDSEAVLLSQSMS